MKKATLLVLSLWSGACTSEFATLHIGSNAFDPAVVSKEVNFQKTRVKNDPKGALGWSMLAGAHLRNARIFDSTEDAIAAEIASKQSLELRSQGNTAAMNRWIQSLLAQHRFQDADEAVFKALALPLYDNTTLQLAAQIALEIGAYERAVHVISKHPAAFADSAGMVVVARNETLHGRPEIALSLIQKARAMITSNRDVPGDVQAWYSTKEGDVFAAMGKNDLARNCYEASLASFPEDYKALTGMARLAADAGKWRDVLSWGTRAEKIVTMPEVLALIGDAHSALGDLDEAEQHYHELAEAAGMVNESHLGHNHRHDSVHGRSKHGHTLDRQYAQFCADHSRDLKIALTAALRDLEEREDVFAMDTLAWVYSRMGRNGEAKSAIDKAVRLGTKDARLLYHAGVIYDQNGQREKAAQFFKSSKDANPKFRPPRIP